MIIEVYEDGSGECFVRNFLLAECAELDRAKIIQKLEDYQEFPYETLMYTQHLKKVENGLYEVRIKVNRVQYRFFGIVKDKILYLGYAIKKKTNKLSVHELRAARAKINRIT